MTGKPAPGKRVLLQKTLSWLLIAGLVILAVVLFDVGREQAPLLYDSQLRTNWGLENGIHDWTPVRAVDPELGDFFSYVSWSPSLRKWVWAEGGVHTLERAEVDRYWMSRVKVYRIHRCRRTDELIVLAAGPPYRKGQGSLRSDADRQPAWSVWEPDVWQAVKRIQRL